MRKLIIAALIMAAPVLAGRRGTYSVERKASLSGAAEVVTVQLPASTNRTARLVGASVYCSVECEFTLERDGSLATTTALTPAKLFSTDATVTAGAYHTSNVGSGTTFARHVVPAGGTLSLDLADVGLKAGETFTVRTASITGTAIVNVKWEEY